MDTKEAKQKGARKNGFILAYFGILFFLALVVMLIYLMVRMNAVDKRMGGLHGDVDRDFKDTNLIVLSRDVANLHEDVRRLFAVVIELTKNETDQIDRALTELRNQVDRETNQIDDALAQETNQIDTNLAQLTQLTKNETDQIDEALTALSNQVDIETDQIDTALAQETNQIDTNLAQLTQLTQKETNDIDSAIGSLSNKVDAETQEIDSSLIDMTKQIDEAEREIGTVLTRLTSAISDHEATVLRNLSGIADTISEQFGGVSIRFDSVDQNLNPIQNKIDVEHKLILDNMGEGFGKLGGQNAQEKDAVLAALSTSNSSLQLAVETVDTVVDGIATYIGTPASAQETVFKEFEQLQKGKQILMYLTWGNGVDIPSQLTTLESKWSSIFTGAKKTIQMTLYSAGEIVADYYFAGEDTTPYNWFIELRLSLVSKGPDLFKASADASPPATGSYFAINPDDDGMGIRNKRMFYVNDNFGGCDADAGWIMVLNKNDGCIPTWFPGYKIVYPLIAYSKKADGSKAVWGNPAEVGFADTLTITTVNL